MAKILSEEEMVSIYEDATAGMDVVSMAAKYGVSEGTIYKYVKGIVKDESQEPEEEKDTELEKQKSAVHRELLEALKEAEVNPKLIAISIKALLNSSDNADVRAGLQAYTKIMVEEGKERTGKKGNNNGVIEKRYVLNLPKKEE